MAQPAAAAFGFGLARTISRAVASPTSSTVQKGHRLIDVVAKELVDEIFAHALKKQTGVSLKYMLDFGANPIERQLILSAQFLHKELPVRLAHRVAELENLPCAWAGRMGEGAGLGLFRISSQQGSLSSSAITPAAVPAAHSQMVFLPSRASSRCLQGFLQGGWGTAMLDALHAGLQHLDFTPVLARADAPRPRPRPPSQVRDWYVESFKELRQFPLIKDAGDEGKFTEMLRHIYRRHANVVPVMAKGVAELRRELVKQQSSLMEMPEIHQFLDGFYLSRIGIRILIGAWAWCVH